MRERRVRDTIGSCLHRRAICFPDTDICLRINISQADRFFCFGQFLYKLLVISFLLTFSNETFLQSGIFVQIVGVLSSTNDLNEIISPFFHFILTLFRENEISYFQYFVDHMYKLIFLCHRSSSILIRTQ